MPKVKPISDVPTFFPNRVLHNLLAARQRRGLTALQFEVAFALATLVHEQDEPWTAPVTAGDVVRRIGPLPGGKPHPDTVIRRTLRELAEQRQDIILESQAHGVQGRSYLLAATDPEDLPGTSRTGRRDDMCRGSPYMETAKRAKARGQTPDLKDLVSKLENDR